MEVISVLKVEPEFGRHLQQLGKPESSVRSDTALPPSQLVEAARGNSHFPGGLDLRQVEWLKKFLKKNLPGGRCFGIIVIVSVVIAMLFMVVLAAHFERVSFLEASVDTRLEAKRNSILIIDSNAKPTTVITFQGLQAVDGRNTEILNRCGFVEHVQLAPNDGPY